MMFDLLFSCRYVFSLVCMCVCVCVCVCVRVCVCVCVVKDTGSSQFVNHDCKTDLWTQTDVQFERIEKKSILIGLCWNVHDSRNLGKVESYSFASLKDAFIQICPEIDKYWTLGGLHSFWYIEVYRISCMIVVRSNYIHVRHFRGATVQRKANCIHCSDQMSVTNRTETSIVKLILCL